MTVKTLSIRLLLLVLPWLVVVRSVHSQPADSPLTFHLRLLKVDANAAASIHSFLGAAPATEGISVAPLPPGMDADELVRRAGAAGSAEILAEPTMLTNDGHEASFLAGSSFPFPVVEPGAGHVSIDWREFGLRLDMLPAIGGAGIGLRVDSDVSFLDFGHAVTVNGFAVPGMTKRHNKTRLDLADGQSFVINGLVDRDLTTAMSKLPGVKDIPLLRDIAALGDHQLVAVVSIDRPAR